MSFGYATDIETIIQDNKHRWSWRIQMSDLGEPIPLLNQGATFTRYTLEIPWRDKDYRDCSLRINERFST